MKMPNGNKACFLGIDVESSGNWILGDSFLRSAYVVYNLDTLSIGLAQTTFNSTSSNVKEIGGNDSSIGTSVSQTVTVYQSATGVLGPDAGATTVSIPASATGQYTLTGAITQAPTGKPTATATQSAASATSSSSGNGIIGSVEGSGLFLAATLVAALVAAL